jgi:Flp pilus assembly protein TadD
LSLAAKTLDQLLEIAPGSAQAHRQVSLLALAQGDYDRAFQFASKAVLLDPNHPESHEVMGHALYFKSQMSSAEKEYDRAIALGSSSYFVTTRYKLALWGAGLSPEPVAQYGNRMLRDDSENYMVRYWIGRAYMLSGLWSEAKKYLEPGAETLKELLKLAPSDANARSYLALYYARLGESANGQVEIDKAVELSSESPLMMYRKAQFYAIQSDKKAEALDWLQRAVRKEYILSEVMNPDFSFLLKDPGFLRAIVASPDSDEG